MQPVVPSLLAVEQGLIAIIKCNTDEQMQEDKKFPLAD